MSKIELINGIGYVDQVINATVAYPYLTAITDRRFNFALPMGPIHTVTDPDPSAPGGEEAFNNRSAGFIVEIGATDFTIKKDAGSTTATGADGRAFAQKWNAEELQNTDSRAHLVNDVSATFAGAASVGTMAILNTGFAATDADKVVYIPRGGYCTAGTSSNRHDNYLSYLPQISAAGAVTIDRGHGAFSALVEGTTIQFGPDWSVHRASVINPTWIATGDSVTSYVDVDMFETRTASGTVSNPEWGQLFFKQCFKLWPTASTDKRRPHNILGFNIDPAPDGRARITVPNETVATWPTDATIWIEVITNPALRATTQSRYFGNVWNTQGVIHNTGTVPWGIDDTSFHNLDPETTLQVVQNINEDAVVTGPPVRGWNGGVLDATQQTVQLYWNSTTDQFLLTSTLVDMGDLNSSAGLATFTATADAYDGTLSVSGGPHAAPIDTIEIQGTDGNWVSLTLLGSPTAAAAQADLTDTYLEGGAFEFIPWETPVPVRVTAAGVESAITDVTIPAPVTGTFGTATTGSAALIANGATDASLAVLQTDGGRTSVAGDTWWFSGPANADSVPNGAIVGTFGVRAFNDTLGWTSTHDYILTLQDITPESDSSTVTITADARPGWAKLDMDTGDKQREFDTLSGAASMLANGDIVYSGSTVDTVNYEEFTP